MGSSAQNTSGVGQVQGSSGKVPKVPEKVWEALVQSQVRFNRVLEKVPVKVWEAFVQSQVRCGRLWCRARLCYLCSTGFRRRFWRRSGRLWSTLRCFQRLASQHASENKTLRLLGIAPTLIHFSWYFLGIQFLDPSTKKFWFICLRSTLLVWFAFVVVLRHQFLHWRLQCYVRGWFSSLCGWPRGRRRSLPSGTCENLEKPR